MATISIQVSETGQTTLTKTFTISDNDLDLIVAAYQSDANGFLHSIATRAQVFNYITGLWADELKVKVQQFKTIPKVVPSPISIT